MMQFFVYLAVAMSLLLCGCATTIRSDVTAFNEWPSQLQDKSYAFDTPAAREDTLEYRNYQNLVRAELSRLGFAEASTADTAKLRVAMHFSTRDRPRRVYEMTDPFWGAPGYWYGGRGYFRGGYGRFGPEPFFYGPMEVRETILHNYERQLRVAINGSDGKKLFDVMVHNTSSKASTPAVMPALVASAFAGFPGQSGVTHQVDLKVE